MNLPNAFLDSIGPKLKDELPAFLDSFQQKLPVSIRLNPFKTTEYFEDAMVVPWHTSGRYLTERPIFTLDPLFHAGTYYVQEASSMFLYQALTQSVDLSESLKVLDLCASPGGKSTLIASIIKENSLLVSNEVIRSRVSSLKQNIEKWGTSNIIISNHDPEDFQPLNSFFDVVLVDAPCSGEGLFRKDENARNEWSQEHVLLCSSRQKRILRSAKDLVSGNGVLIYSTCTFNDAENDENMKWLLESGEFDLVEIALKNEWNIEQTKFGYQFFPHKVMGEGFYLSILRKKENFAERQMKMKPLKELTPLTKLDISEIRNWITESDSYQFYLKPNSEVIAVPISIEEASIIVANSLKRRSIGVRIGEFKRKNFVPSHALALSSMIKNDLPFVDLTLDQALIFFKKENLEIPSEEKGWHLAKYKGHNLGWMKILENRINNYLPNEWRIRMDINK